MQLLLGSSIGSHGFWISMTLRKQRRVQSVFLLGQLTKTLSIETKLSLLFFFLQSEVNSDSNWEERGERKITVKIERLDYR